MTSAERPVLTEKHGIVALLEKHEARWTTHGNDRIYQVMHCAGDCDWRLRQKALMSDDYCYELHREHLAEMFEQAIRDAYARYASEDSWGVPSHYEQTLIEALRGKYDKEARRG